MTTTISSPRRGLTLADYAVAPLGESVILVRDGSHIVTAGGYGHTVTIPDLIAAACDDALHNPDHHAEDLTLRLDKSDLRFIVDGLQMLADTCRDEADRLGAFDESGEVAGYLFDSEAARQLAEQLAPCTSAVLTPIDEASDTKDAA